MDSVFVTATFASMDAGAELTWMYLQRVSVANTEFMSERNSQLLELSENNG